MQTDRTTDYTQSIRPRGPERRSGFWQFLGDVGSALTDCHEPGSLRFRLEEALRRLLQARSLQLRELVAGSSASHSLPPGHALSSEVPTTGTPMVLEASLDESVSIDEWRSHLAHMAGTVAGLVLEIERVRLSATRRPFATARGREGLAPLVGSSAAMHALRQRIERVSGTDFTVLIEGESGSGKELVARQIHEMSRRRRGPFVAVNCAALVETLLEAELFGIEDRTATGVRGRRGKFEHADGGTLFLDEVSDLSVSAQAKLLRAIQDLAVERVGGQGSHRVDARIVVATNRSLADLVQRSLFRSDLYYRLNGVEIRVPPLRARREDVPELAEHFLERHRALRRLRLSPAAADALLAYHWPGNVRELQRVIERAVALSEFEEIRLEDLPPEVRREYSDLLLPSLERADTLRAWGSRYARLMLERHGNNKRRACRALGISYHTLQAYLRYQASPDDQVEGDSPAEGTGGA